MTTKTKKSAYKRLTKKDYIKAITEAQGLISVAARRLGVSRSTLYSAIDRHKDVAAALADARERTTDLAEGRLYEKINEGDTSSIIFYLRTQGRNRGYVERTESEVSVRGEVLIDLVELPHDPDRKNQA